MKRVADGGGEGRGIAGLVRRGWLSGVVVLEFDTVRDRRCQATSKGGSPHWRRVYLQRIYAHEPPPCSPIETILYIYIYVCIKRKKERRKEKESSKRMKLAYNWRPLLV